MKQPTNSKLRYSTLLTLSQKPASSITSLAQEVGVLRSSMSRAVKTLQDGGFIRRESRTLILTGSGQEELHRLMATSPKTGDIAVRILEQTLQQARQVESWIKSPTMRALQSAVDNNQYLSQAARTFENNSKMLAAGTSLGDVAKGLDIGTSLGDVAKGLGIGTSLGDVAKGLDIGTSLGDVAKGLDIGTSLGDVAKGLDIGSSAFHLVGTSLGDVAKGLDIGSSAFHLVGTSLGDVAKGLGIGTFQIELMNAINATAQIQSINLDWFQSWHSENSYLRSHLLVENNAFLSGMLIDLEAIGKINTLPDMAQSLIARTSEATNAYRDYIKGVTDGFNQVPDLVNLELGFVVPTTTTATLVGSARNIVESHSVSRAEEKRDSTGTTRVRIYSEQYVAISSMLENYLRPLGGQFIRKWHGAWQTLSTESEDRYSQATHSGRELLMQVLAHLAPDSSFTEEEIAKNNGKSPTRRMRIKHILESSSKAEWADKIAAALDSTYDILAAESHSREDSYRIDSTAAGELIVLGGLLLTVLSRQGSGPA